MAVSTTGVGAARNHPALDKAKAYVALTKPRIIELLLVTTVPTMVVAARGVPSGWLILETLVGGTLAAGGANAINMYVDRDIDAIMRRTSRRPLVTGALAPAEALRFAVALEVAAFVELAVLVNLLSAVLAVTATLFYVFVYTLWLKRTSTQNIVIGGAAGAMPVLVGWAAVRGSVSLAPIVLFLVIFVWTPPHFWALAIRYRADYAAAEVPMLPGRHVASVDGPPDRRLHRGPVGRVAPVRGRRRGRGDLLGGRHAARSRLPGRCHRVVPGADRGPSHAAVRVVDHLPDPPVRRHRRRPAGPPCVTL